MIVNSINDRIYHVHDDEMFHDDHYDQNNQTDHDHHDYDDHEHDDLPFRLFDGEDEGVDIDRDDQDVHF